MRRLFLIRHAKAEPSVGRGDFERKLIERGRADARRVAEAMLARNMLPDVLIHSGAARSKETAEIFASVWEGRAPLEEDRALYDASQSTLFGHARELPDARARIAFVGHNPGLGELAASLVGSGAAPGASRMAAKFPTSAVAALDFSASRWRDIARHAGMLALFLTPSELQADAD